MLLPSTQSWRHLYLRPIGRKQCTTTATASDVGLRHIVFKATSLLSHPTYPSAGRGEAVSERLRGPPLEDPYPAPLSSGAPASPRHNATSPTETRRTSNLTRTAPSRYSPCAGMQKVCVGGVGVSRLGGAQRGEPPASREDVVGRSMTLGLNFIVTKQQAHRREQMGVS